MRCFSKKAGQKIVAFLVFFSILLSFASCQKAENNLGFLEGDSLTSFEELYGLDHSQIFKALNFSDDDVLQGTDPGTWEVKEPVFFQGIEFSEMILCDVSSETLYGIRYSYRTEDKTKVMELVENLLNESNNLYGEPSTYPGLPNRLTSETFSDDFSGAMVNGNLSDWREDWSVGEKTNYTLSLSVVGPNVAMITLEYCIDWRIFYDRSVQMSP